MLIGIDIIDHVAFKRFIRYKKFLPHVFTQSELDAANRYGNHYRIKFLSGRFAAKEAFLKSLGIGLLEDNILLTDIEILNHENGKPYLTIKNHLKELFESYGVLSYDISISHSNNYTIAAIVSTSNNSMVPGGLQ